MPELPFPPDLTGLDDLATADPVTRRALLERIAALGGLAAALAVIASLGGCATSDDSGSMVGRPIPPDPTLRPVPKLPPIPKRPEAKAGTAPGVIARSEWARFGPNIAETNPMGRVQRITVHHEGATPFTSTSKSEVARRMESIRRSHRDRGFADIGYHYVVDPAGRVWQGRATSLQGAHVKDNNENNLGIMVLGNFDRQRPTAAQITTLDAFVAGEMRRYNVGPGNVFTHQELNPSACPGRNLQTYMVASRGRGGNIARA